MPDRCAVHDATIDAMASGIKRIENILEKHTNKFEAMALSADFDRQKAAEDRMKMVQHKAWHNGQEHAQGQGQQRVNLSLRAIGALLAVAAAVVSMVLYLARPVQQNPDEVAAMVTNAVNAAIDSKGGAGHAGP